MPNNGSGLDAVLSFGTEATYGTGVTPTKSAEFDKEAFERVKNTVQGMGLKGGSVVARSKRRRTTTRAAKGRIDADLTSAGLSPFWVAFFGQSAQVQGTGGNATVFTQTHTLSGNVGKSMTIQKGVPTATGTVEPFTYVGCKPSSLEISIDVDGLFKFGMDFDARDELTTATTPAGPALAAAAYSTTAAVYSFSDSVLTLGGTAIAAVKKASVKVTRAMNTSRFYLGQGGLKAEPLTNAYIQLAGSFDAEFISRAALFDAYVSDAPLTLVLGATSPFLIPGSTTPYSFSFSLGDIRLEGETPKVDGPDIVGQSIPFTGLDPETTPTCTFTYVTSDSTLT